MSSKTEKIFINFKDFHPTKSGGKFQGLGNLLRTEISRWRHSITWWLQIFAVIIFANGITFMAMLSSGGEEGIGLMMFPLMSGIFVSLSAMTMIQGAIVKEKVEGTAAWVLSKPVTRVAFMTSKFITNCISMTLALVLLPWIVAYLMFTGMGEIPVNADTLTGLFLAMGIFWFYCMFWLTMALMLGSIFKSRRPVMYGMVIVFFLFIGMANLIPQAFNPLSFWPGTAKPDPSYTGQPISMISDLLLGNVYINWGPVVFGVCCILFLAIAFIRFSKVEL